MVYSHIMNGLICYHILPDVMPSAKISMKHREVAVSQKVELNNDRQHCSSQLI